ncbi:MULTISPECIES: sugar ABC transporter permease [unclassified Streptomyces]|uniref:carbohydrate ABC transporter permease n=1 Tax=Streptomyces TaxID=1883 RepID=UPI0001C1AC1F|nr:MULTISPECIES: sugar ABC transporter permease [unclassified Streptomyces]MYR69132.1 ABC transporter permease subunit [Streptomyces sp. SID4939]MYS04526.1 ABC transporter permease subunit [Streptomyces sp. SID4940]MYT64042.1 ABC transporter permease subunit [Streptomyces sp. SID8357]MYT86973.1 ABC transporter permease subunit [Streptomyces sp. SID8360]MYU31900.1 ABC transporter permease subunit [Streptomyces sp. SID8358]MYW36359.1 ABC transporter permease subunit [Streptomyces sp. SID1]MYX7
MTHIQTSPGTLTPAAERNGPAAEAPPGGRERTGGRENLAGYLFMSPWIAGFLFLIAGPMVFSLYLSFTEYNLFDAPRWIGLRNFTDMFADPRWRQSVKVTSWYVLIGTPVKLAAALAVAVLLARKRWGQAFYRAAFYAPSLIGASVSAAIVWRALFSDGALVDRTQKVFGVEVGGWIGDPQMIIYALAALTVWQFGAPMVIFLAGLKQVPRELYEAAEVDGAGPWRRFFHITLPMISPVLFFNVLLETIHSFQIFGSAYIVSNGTCGPADATLVYTCYLYEQGFVNSRMGFASAMGWLLLVTVGLVTAVLFRSQKRWVHYEEGGR